MSVHTTHVKLMWCGTNWNYLIFSPFLFSIVCIFLWLNFSSSYHKWQVMFWKWCCQNSNNITTYFVSKKTPTTKNFCWDRWDLMCVCVCFTFHDWFCHSSSYILHTSRYSITIIHRVESPLKKKYLYSSSSILSIV